MTDDTLLGTKLAGRYRVERRLGMGGMGAVYLAVQDPLGRAVALKVLRPHLIADPVAVERFKNEARTIASVHHPHIVGVHDFGETADGTLYLVMEYLEGRTLAEALRSDGPMPWERTLSIVRDVARALSAAHRRGVVHRDLKPDNIVLVDVDGEDRESAKVLDFGIAKLVKGDEQAKNLTGTGFVPGTPGYIAPEQILGERDDLRCDLYALGVTWFEMLAGRRPFVADTAMKVFLAHLNDPVPAVGDVHAAAHVPPPVEALLRALLAKDPDERPKDADALLDRLRALAVQGFAPAAGSETPAAPLPTAVDLTPAERTMSALETPLAGVAAPAATTTAGTPSTGTSATPTKPSTASRLKGVAKASAPGVKRAAFLGVFVLLLGAAAAQFWFFTRANEGNFFRLPTIETDPRFRTELDVLNRLLVGGDPIAAEAKAEAILVGAPQEPWPHFIRALAATWVDDWGLREASYGAAAELLASPDVGNHEDYGAALIGLVAQTRGATPDEFVRAWQACDACRKHRFGLLAGALLLGKFAPNAVPPYEAALDEMRTLYPDDAGPKILRAAHLLRFQNVAGAVEEAQAAVKASPGSSLARVVLGRALIAADRCAEAGEALQAAAERGGGRGAQLALAEHVLLCERPSPEADKRRAALVGVEATRSPAILGQLARAHGPALASAGRPTEAAALFRTALEAAIAAKNGYVAAPTLLWNEQALESIGAVDELFAMERRSDDVAALEMTRMQRKLFQGSRYVLEGIAALRQGNVARAEGHLRALNDLGDDALPASMRPSVTAHLAYDLAAAKGDVAAGWQAAEAFGSACRRAALKTILLAAHGRPGPDGKETRVGRPEGEPEVQELLRTLPACRVEEFAGGVVLRAVIALAERAEDDGRVDDLAAHLALVDRSWPWLDPASVVGKQALAVGWTPAAPPKTP